MDFETVTVIALARNGVESIRQTLESLVNQTRRPDRIVVADVGSSDGSYRVLCDLIDIEPIEHEGARALPPKGEGVYRSVPVTTLRMPPRTMPSQCINAAVDVAGPETTILGIVSPGAAWLPDKVRKSVAVLQAHPAVVAVVSDFRVEHAGGGPTRVYGRPFDWFQLLAGPMHDSNVLVRKVALDHARAAFDPHRRHAVFYEMFLRLARIGLIYHLPEMLHTRPEENVPDDEAFRSEFVRFRDAFLKGMT